MIARHAVVRELVEHQWLHLHCIVPGEDRVLQRRGTEWAALASAG